MDDGERARAIGIVGADPLVAASTVALPSDVAKTVVAASEPTLPTIRTVVVIGFAVGLVNTSTVRAKSSCPCWER